MTTNKPPSNGQDIESALDRAGTRFANKALGRPLNDSKVEEFIAGRLARASEDDRYSVADALCTALAVVNVARTVLAGGVTKDEALDVGEILEVLEEDVVGALQDLAQ